MAWRTYPARLREVEPLSLGLGAAALLAGGALGLLPLSVAAALLVGPVLTLLVMSDPLWGLYALVLSVPVQELVLLPGGLTVTQAVSGLALLGWVVRMLGQREIALPRPLLLPWLAFLLTMLASSAFPSYGFDEPVKELPRWLAAFLAFELTVVSVTSRWRAVGLILCLLAGPLASALMGLRQFFTADGPPSFQIGPYVRAYGPFGKPNPLAGYLNMAWPLAVAPAIYLLVLVGRRGARLSPPALALGLASAGVGLVLLAALGATYSRGGWVGALAAAALIALFSGRWGVLACLVGAGAGAAAVAAGDLLPASIAGRLTSITSNLRIFDAALVTVTHENFAIVERMAHWQAGARMFLAHPLLGVGPGNFHWAYPDFYVGQWYISQGHAHNIYIHMAAELGLVGLLAYLWLIGATAREGLLALRTTAGVWRAVAIGGCGIIAAVIAHQLFEKLHVLNMGIQLSAVWGLLVWLARGGASGGNDDLSSDRRGGLRRQPSG